MTRNNKPADVEWGVTSIDEAVCTVCGCCVAVCPSLCIRMRDGKPVVVTDGTFGCLACGHCMAVCPSGAVCVTGRGMRGEDVFPLPPLSARATTDALEGLFQARRSTRHYEDKHVEKAIIEARKENSDLLFYDAPCVILFHYPMKDTIDPTIACSFATMAAEALGLGSCMIGTVAPALQGNRKLKTKWGIPAKNFPAIAMTLGYPSVTYRNGIRRRFTSVEYR